MAIIALALAVLLVFLQLDNGEEAPAAAPSTAPADTVATGMADKIGSDDSGAPTQGVKQPAQEIASAGEPSSDPAPERMRHLRRSRELALDRSLAAIATAYREAGIERFAIPAFDGNSVHVAIRRVTDHHLGGTVLSGQVVGEPSSQVTLAEKDGAIGGAIRWPARNLVYEIRPRPGGRISIGEVDLHALGECGLCAAGAVATRGDP